MNSRNKNASAIIAIVFLLTSVRINLHPPVNAQTIGDTLPTRIPTPTYTLSPSSSPNQPQVWVGRLASDTLGVTEGQGSIIRVSVNGLPDTAIELNNGSQLITAKSGTKPEYGPYAAEFAPVPAGIWTISVPALGASINVETDNYNLAIIEFVQVPASAATQVVLPTVTATPLGAVEWEGQIVSETAGKNVPFARLLIQVAGRNGQPVQLATLTQVVNTAFTGQKPDELGPNMVEFAGLTPGRYFVDPLGLNVSLPVELKPNTETRVEFQPKVVTPTPLPTATETPTSIPVPPTTTFVPTKTATPTPLPTQTATPLPLPTPVTQWVGAIEARTDRGSGLSAIIVKVTGAKTVPITLNAGPRPDANCVTNAEQSLCQFTGLLPGTYTVAPQGLGIILPVTVSGHELVQIIFNKQSFPAGVTGWQAQITRNSNGGLATALAQGIITANVEGQPGQIVSLRSTQPGQRQFCEVAQTPDGLGCQFTNLGPGIYTIEALNTQARLKLFVDGVGQATVKFTPNATYATQELNKQPAVVGKGASPKRPTVVAAAPLPLPTFTPTVTPPAQPTRTPTPALGWQGRVVGSDVTGAGAIAVRSAGLKDHPVIVRSGDWQSNPQLTGTKPEWGDYATEFGGLSPGEYVVELVDLAELKIILEGGQFLLIEFRYDVISSP